MQVSIRKHKSFQEVNHNLEFYFANFTSELIKSFNQQK